MLKKALLFLLITSTYVATSAPNLTLLEAAQKGNMQKIKQALAANSDVTARNARGRSVIFLLALHAYINSGNRKEQFLDLIRQVSQMPGAPVKDLELFNKIYTGENKDQEIRDLFDEELNFGQDAR